MQTSTKGGRQAAVVVHGAGCGRSSFAVAGQRTTFLFSSPVASFVVTSFISEPFGTSDPRLADPPVADVFVPPPVVAVAAVPPPTFAVRPPVPVRAAFGGILSKSTQPPATSQTIRPISQPSSLKRPLSRLSVLPTPVGFDLTSDLKKFHHARSNRPSAAGHCERGGMRWTLAAAIFLSVRRVHQPRQRCPAGSWLHKDACRERDAPCDCAQVQGLEAATQPSHTYALVNSHNRDTRRYCTMPPAGSRAWPRCWR